MIKKNPSQITEQDLAHVTGGKGTTFKGVVKDIAKGIAGGVVSGFLTGVSAAAMLFALVAVMYIGAATAEKFLLLF